MSIYSLTYYLIGSMGGNWDVMIVADTPQKETSQLKFDKHFFTLKLNKETIQMAKSMNELLDIINATDPDSGEEFLKLLQPEKYDRYEMGSILEVTLGNDLTCYYDKKDIRAYLNYLMKHDDIDEEVKEYIKDNKDEIVDQCYIDFDGDRTLYLHGIVEGHLEKVLSLGYNISDIIDDGDLNPEFDEDGNLRFVATDSEDEDIEEFDIDPDELDDNDNE